MVSIVSPLARNNLTSSTPWLRIICQINDATMASGDSTKSSCTGEGEDSERFWDGMNNGCSDEEDDVSYIQ